MTDNPSNIRDQSDALNHVQKAVPQALDALSQLAHFSLQSTTLNTKIKALLTLALAIQNQQSDCIVYHVKNALAQQVSLEEMKEIVLISAYMGGGPGMMSAEKALSIFEELSDQSKT